MPKDAKSKGKSRMADLRALKIAGVAAGLEVYVFLGALLIHLETISKYPYIGIRARSIILKWHVPEQLADAFLIGTYPHRLDAVEKQGLSTPTHPSSKSHPMQT